MEEVKLVLKPAYNTRKITKDAYKEILRKTVPKVCTYILYVTPAYISSYHFLFRFATLNMGK